MADLTYRLATLADLPFMVGLIAADDVSGTPMDNGTDPNGTGYTAAMRAIADDPNQELYIVELSGAAVGTFQLTFLPGIMRRGMWRGLVESVHVAPAIATRGWASR